MRQRWYAEGFFTGETLTDAILAGAAAYPQTEVVFAGDERPGRASLADLVTRSTHVAAGLAAAGVRPGDVVAVQVPNWLEGAIVYVAAFRLGVTVVPIIHIYGPREVAFILRQSGAGTLVVPAHWRGIDYAERVAQLEDVPALARVVVLGEGGPAGGIPWADLDRPASGSVAPAPVAPDDVAVLVYTSGTTGDPKGVQHTHSTLLAEVRANASVLGDGPLGVSMGALPAGHIAGVLGLLRSLVLGSKGVFLDVWEPGLAAALVEQHGVTSTAGTPFHLRSLLDAADRDGRDLSTLTRFMVGATVVPRSIIEEAEARGITAYRAYGSSEHPVLSTGTPDDPLERRATTDGRLTPGNEVRIVDEDGVDVAPGDEGEVVCRGPEQFVGYRDPGVDETAFLPGGWFRTGDVARFVDGYLTITDRKKDIIIRGGENIASREVEEILLGHPDVVDVAVVAGPDPRLGEQVCAFVVLRPGTTLDLPAARALFAAAGVAKQKAPERLVVVDELPRGPGGKVVKVELRRRLGAVGADASPPPG